MEESFNSFMNDNPIYLAIFVIIFGIAIILYSLSNIKYSKKRMNELENEVKTDKSKYFNYGINKSIYTRAIISIIMAIGMIIYGLVLIVKNIL